MYRVFFGFFFSDRNTDGDFDGIFCTSYKDVLCLVKPANTRQLLPKTLVENGTADLN